MSAKAQPLATFDGRCWTPEQCWAAMGHRGFAFASDEARAMFFAWQQEQIDKMNAKDLGGEG
tara:strand:- start:15226 stop:15411 length:186 start_codon:yes stop_codon:yes gene_type:complete